MSYAISRLGLYQPPAHIQRIGSRYAPMWRAVCDGCGHVTRTREAIGLCLHDLADHAAIEALQLTEPKAAWLAERDLVALGLVQRDTEVSA